MTKRFKTNKKYSMRSICDSNCIWTYKVIKRTEKSIWLQMENGLKRLGIKVYNNEEYVYPLGQYSMAPALTPSGLN